MAGATPLIGQTDESSGKLLGVELSEVSKQVNDGLEHDLPWELLLAGLGATLMLIVFITARRWWLARQDDPSPLVLYSAIARKAGLTWGDRLLLWRIARAGDLPTPIALLLARGAMRHYAGRFIRQRAPRSAERTRHKVARIEATLFG